MKNVIITGACGFIGKALTKYLLEQGVQVYAIVKDRDNLMDLQDRLNLAVITADFSQYSVLPQLINRQGFDAFFHLAWAGYGKATHDYQVQIENVRYTCEAAMAAAKVESTKFIFADSSHEYQLNHYQNDKSGPVGLCSVYGAAKHAAFRFCNVIAHNNNMQLNGVAFTNVFGPGDRSLRSANTIIKKMLQGEPIDLIQGEYLYDWSFIDDVIGGIVATAERGISEEVYYVGSNRLRPFRDIVMDVNTILGSPSHINLGTYPDTAYIDYSNINIYKLYQHTGYIPTSNFSDAVLKTADWVKTLNY